MDRTKLPLESSHASAGSTQHVSGDAWPNPTPGRVCFLHFSLVLQQRVEVFPSILRGGHRDILRERHQDHRPDVIRHWLSAFFTVGPRTGLLSEPVECLLVRDEIRLGEQAALMVELLQNRKVE